MIEIVAASGGGSVEDPPTQLLSLSLLLTVTSLSLKFFFTIFCLLLPVLLFNAATAISKFKSKPPEKSITDAIEKGKDKYGKLLSEAIKLKTISYDGLSSDDTTNYGEVSTLT